MESKELELTVEQQFRLITLETAIMQMTLEEAREYVRELTKQQMLKDNLFKRWVGEGGLQ